MSTLVIAGDAKDRNEKAKDSFVTRGVTKTVLPNGLTVLTKESHDHPVVATIIWYRVGSKNEELGQTGKSHFLEHMLFKGTDRYKKGDIDLITLKNGGANNAFTWLDFTAYYFTFASDRWQAALEIEANRMRHTTFAEQEFQPEKKVVEEELHIGLDGPWEALENEVWATAFKQHPYHWPTVGWIEDLERATAADMKAYYDKWYHPQNATLVIVGDFDTQKTLAKIADLFGQIPRGPEAAPLHIEEPPQHGQKRVIVKKATPVERMLIGYHAPAVAEPDSYVLHVIEALLSTGKTSRLYKRLVEHDQSVTLARASYEDHIDPSLFSIQAELKPGFKLPDVEQAISDEIDKLKTGLIPAAELDKAKRQIEADLVLSNEEPLQQAMLLGQYETIAFSNQIPAESRGYRYLATYLDKIAGVTAGDIGRVARKYFTPENRTVGYLEDDGTSGGAGSLPAAPSAGSSSRSGVAAQTSHGAASSAGKGVAAKRFPRAAFRSGGGGLLEEAAGSRPHLDVEKDVLPNGLVLLLSENHSSPSVAIKAVVNAGSRFESNDKAGLASLVGELIEEGTKTHSSDEIAQSVEGAGGRLETFAEYQSSIVQSSFLAKDLPLGLDITADLLMNADFPEDKVKLYINRRMAQIKSRLDVPRVEASDALNEILFKGHPEHRPPIGYTNTVKALTRQDMIEFYREYYVPNNTILAIVGDIDKADVKKRVLEAFEKWRTAPDFKLPQIAQPSRQSEPVSRFITAPKEQVNIYVGQVGIDRANPDYYSLLVFDTILGSSPGFTSRIPRILRDEQGLAYSTFSNITGSARLDPGRFAAYIGTSPQNLDKALSGLRREIARIVAEPVSEDELEGAKDYLTGNFVFDFQTNSQVAQFLIDAETYHLGFDYFEKYPVAIRAVTVDDVSRVARKYIYPERMTTVVVGPVDGSGKLLNR